MLACPAREEGRFHRALEALPAERRLTRTGRGCVQWTHLQASVCQEEGSRQPTGEGVTQATQGCIWGRRMITESSLPQKSWRRLCCWRGPQELPTPSCRGSPTIDFIGHHDARDLWPELPKLRVPGVQVLVRDFPLYIKHLH